MHDCVVYSVPVVWSQLVFLGQNILCRLIFIEDKRGKFIALTNRCVGGGVYLWLGEIFHLIQTIVQLVFISPLLLQWICWFCECHSPYINGQCLHSPASLPSGQSCFNERVREV